MRGEENADHTWTAEMIGERPNGGFGGAALAQEADAVLVKAAPGAAVLAEDGQRVCSGRIMFLGK